MEKGVKMPGKYGTGFQKASYKSTFFGFKSRHVELQSVNGEGLKPLFSRNDISSQHLTLWPQQRKGMALPI